jgi:hypothetical protein
MFCLMSLCCGIQLLDPGRVIFVSINWSAIRLGQSVCNHHAIIRVCPIFEENLFLIIILRLVAERLKELESDMNLLVICYLLYQG